MKRTLMTLYSDDLVDTNSGLQSHKVRLVLAEKGVSAEIILVDPKQHSEDLLELNPYYTLPTLVDRDLVVFQAGIIMEYLDERFPHPPLLPVYPVSRARCRVMMFRIERDWYSLVSKMEGTDAAVAKSATEELRQVLISVIPFFEQAPYFLSEEFTLVDCCIAPLLWRLPLFGIELPPACKPIHKYMNRVFARDAFQNSLTEAERVIREKSYF